MPPITGQLRKMQTVLDNPVSYFLKLDNQRIDLNPLLGEEITLAHTGRIVCVSCQRVTKKSFSQGHCYTCFRKLASTDQCVMSPEKCHFHEGTCRDPEWGQSYCMQDHTVYLANSSGIKVGITREKITATRWMDQGAVQGMPVIAVSTRRLAGLVEATLRQFVSDRTSWQKMLKGDVPDLDLSIEWERLLPLVSAKIDELKAAHGEDSIRILPRQTVTDISYPVTWHPTRVTSFNFDKSPIVSGLLQGIKGQYLIFDSGVINLRKFTGYEIEFDTGNSRP